MAVLGAPAVRRLGGRTRTIMTALEKQKRLVIVGATGMVGGYALRYALAHPAVELVTTIGRRKIRVLHSKLNEILHQDFADCSALAGVLSRQVAAVFCLGLTYLLTAAELRSNRKAGDFLCETSCCIFGRVTTRKNNMT